MARGHHTAWTPPSLNDTLVLLGGFSSWEELTGQEPSTHENPAHLSAETIPGGKDKKKHFLLNNLGGAKFALEHNGAYACGIVDADTIVMTGGFIHNYVTRWGHGKLPRWVFFAL